MYDRPKMRSPDGSAKFWQLKLDGHWTVYHGGRWLSRQGTDLTEKLEYLSARMRDVEDTHIIAGELCDPTLGADASSVKTAINARRAVFRPFAILNADADLSLWILKRYFEDRGLTVPPWGDLEGGSPPWDDWPDAEGFVLKDGNLSNWQKCKREETYDLRVVGRSWSVVRPGEIEALLVEGGHRVSGFTTEERLMFSALSEEDLRKQIIEVRCNGKMRTQGLRHPRFIRVREDLM